MQTTVKDFLGFFKKWNHKIGYSQPSDLEQASKLYFHKAPETLSEIYKKLFEENHSGKHPLTRTEVLLLGLLWERTIAHAPFVSEEYQQTLCDIATDLLRRGKNRKRAPTHHEGYFPYDIEEYLGYCTNGMKNNKDFLVHNRDHLGRICHYLFDKDDLRLSEISDEQFERVFNVQRLKTLYPVAVKALDEIDREYRYKISPAWPEDIQQYMLDQTFLIGELFFELDFFGPQLRARKPTIFLLIHPKIKNLRITISFTKLLSLLSLCKFSLNHPVIDIGREISTKGMTVFEDKDTLNLLLMETTIYFDKQETQAFKEQLLSFEKDPKIAAVLQNFRHLYGDI